MKPRRVLVTGSRKWVDEGAVQGALYRQWEDHDGPLLVVHGGCPTGADYIAHQWACDWAVQTEVHKPDWSIGSRRAGPIRNAWMVDLGADICLAFVLDEPGESRGTRDCIRRAQKAGIPVVEHVALAPSQVQVRLL